MGCIFVNSSIVSICYAINENGTYIDMVGVTGSIPVAPTINLRLFLFFGTVLAPIFSIGIFAWHYGKPIARSLRDQMGLKSKLVVPLPNVTIWDREDPGVNSGRNACSP